MKFSIRDLLLVTVIVALAVGWGVNSARWAISEQVNEAYYQQELKLSAKEFARLRNRIAELEAKLLNNSSAPAPNPPNP